VNYKKPTHELILKEYIKEILYEEKDNIYINEESPKTKVVGGVLKWIGVPSLLYGTLCYARNTEWETFATDLIALGGAETGIVVGLHKGNKVLILTSAIFAYAWNSHPDMLRNAGFLTDVLNVLNLLPSHESRNFGWTLATLVVPMGAEVAVARRRGIAALRKDAPGSLEIDDVLDPNFTGIVTVDQGFLNALWVKLRILNTFIRDRKFAEALGFINSDGFADALRAGVNNADEILEKGGQGARASDPESIIRSMNEGITKILKENTTDRERHQWLIWHYVQKPLRAAERRANVLKARVNAFNDVTQKQWRSLATHTNNTATINLGTDGMGRKFSGIVDHEISVLGTYGDKVIFRLRSEGGDVTRLGLPGDTLTVDGVTTGRAVAEGWQPGGTLTLKKAPAFQPGLHPGKTDVLGDVPFELNWVDSADIPVMMYDLPAPVSVKGDLVDGDNTMPVLMALKDDVFGSDVYKIPLDAEGASKYLTPTSISGVAVVGAELARSYPMESGSTEVTDSDMIAWELVEARLKKGAAAAAGGPAATSGGCMGLELGSKAWDTIKNAFLGLAAIGSGVESINPAATNSDDVDSESKPEDDIDDDLPPAGDAVDIGWQ
jgi:hypothetical protein